MAVVNWQSNVIPPGVNPEIYTPMYRAGTTGVTLYSTAAAVLAEIVGSATKTIRVKRIKLHAQAGTKFYTELQLLRSTTVSGTGSATAITGRPVDTLDAAATAVVNSYAAAATYGTGHLVIGASGLYVGAPAATNSIGSVEWDFVKTGGRGLVLRGVTDVLQVYNTITALGTATFGFEVEWVEDNS